MPQIKFEVLIETGYHTEDADVIALNFLAEALHKALGKKGPVTSFSARLISYKELANQNRPIHIGAITQGEKS